MQRPSLLRAHARTCANLHACPAFLGGAEAAFRPTPHTQTSPSRLYPNQEAAETRRFLCFFYPFLRIFEFSWVRRTPHELPRPRHTNRVVGERERASELRGATGRRRVAPTLVDVVDDLRRPKKTLGSVQLDARLWMRLTGTGRRRVRVHKKASREGGGTVVVVVVVFYRSYRSFVPFVAATGGETRSASSCLRRERGVSQPSRVCVWWCEHWVHTS